MSVIKVVLSGLTSVILSFAVNIAFKKAGVKGIALAGPLFEEIFKTGAALFFDVLIPITHIFFGFAEAVYDYAWGERNKISAGIFGVFSHAVFGLITFYIINRGFPVYIGIVAAVALHIALNIIVLKISDK